MRHVTAPAGKSSDSHSDLAGNPGYPTNKQTDIYLRECSTSIGA